MEEDYGEDLPEEPRESPEVIEQRRREARQLLKEMDHRWSSEGDSEVLWNEQHQLLITLQETGDLEAVNKRARRVKRAGDPKATAKDLADAALGLWVTEQFDEAAGVLRRAVDRLPNNRYPYSLLLRHLTWERNPKDAMEFILSSIDRVPWRAYALVQLGTMCIDSANKGLASGALDHCQEHLRLANDYLSQVASSEDASDELSRTSERLIYLVETLGKRLEDARMAKAAKDVEGEEVVFLQDGEERLEAGIRKVAEDSGVELTGEVDQDMDLDELEKAAMGELGEENDDETFTVLEVTPKRTLGVKKRAEA
jgi:hypothetical protein